MDVENINKLLESTYVIVRQSYFKEMEESFEYLLEALTANSPGDVAKAIKTLNYIRSGFDLQSAKRASKQFEKHLFLTEHEVEKSFESTINGIRDN